VWYAPTVPTTVGDLAQQMRLKWCGRKVNGAWWYFKVEELGNVSPLPPMLHRPIRKYAFIVLIVDCQLA